jgi:hypothetical protein
VNLTLAEKLALIYTSAGSQRAVAALVGISHQKVGRILRTGYEGGFLPTSRALSDPGLIAAVNQGLAIHSDIARSQARVHGLPFTSALPVFYERKPITVTDPVQVGTYVDKETGEIKPKIKYVPRLDSKGRIVTYPGDRVAALHTHWLSNRVRNSWFAFIQAAGKFYNASIGSVVNLVTYTKRADKENIGFRDDGKTRDKDSITNKIQQNVVQGMIFTKYTAFERGLPISGILADMYGKLNQKHSPAVGDPGTALATQILLQVDTRKNANDESRDSEFRNRHPRPPKPSSRAAKRGKARGNQSRNKRR